MAKSDDRQMIVKPIPDALAASLSALPTKGLPPVHLWNPPYCGEMDMRIARDGTWYHDGTPIGRPALVALFEGILKREGDRYFLVTPVEKLGIRVDDAPMLAVDFDVTGSGADQVLTFRTKTGVTAVAGADHPLRVEHDDIGAPAPYVRVRDDLWALIDRKSFYRMIDLGTQAKVDGQMWFGIWSSAAFFPMIPVADLP